MTRALACNLAGPTMAWLAELRAKRGAAHGARSANGRHLVSWELEIRESITRSDGRTADPRQLSLLEDTADQLTMPGNGQQLTGHERDASWNRARARRRLYPRWTAAGKIGWEADRH